MVVSIFVFVVCLGFTLTSTASLIRCRIDAQWSGPEEIAALKKSSTPIVEGTGPFEEAIEASCSSQNCTWIWASGSLDNATGVVRLHRNDGKTMHGQISTDCSQIRWGHAATWSNLNFQIKKVHVVFMAHFDVGYTDNSVSDLLHRYATDWFPAAFQTAKEVHEHSAGPQQFAWTSHPWLIAALLKNQSENIPPSFIEDLEAAIKSDIIRWHANPMNMQSEAGERFNMEYGMTLATELDKRFGKDKKITASQKDEPGMTLGMVQMFADAGVKLLHIGVNDFSTVPAFPTNSAHYHSYCNPAAWQDEYQGSVSELLVLYCSGYSGPFEAHLEVPNMMTVIPGHDEALVYLMHVDNSGPQNSTQVLAGYAAAEQWFPHANVTLSTMDAWARGLLQARTSLSPIALPTIRGVEVGSTWVYGVASQPQKMRWYRAVARVAARAVKDATVDIADPRFREFQRLMLKVPEHTWGASSGCTGNYTNVQFHDPSYECFPGKPKYNSYVGSLTDQQRFVTRAIEALGDLQPLKKNCEDAILMGEPEMPDLTGLEKFDWTRTLITSAGITVRFNVSGAITNLERNGRRFAYPGNLLGLFQYATHSEEELDDFGSQYCLASCATACGRCGFSKCNISKAGAESAHHQPQIETAWMNTTTGRFVLKLIFPGADLRAKYGPPGYATVEFRFMPGETKDAINVHVDLQWWNKTATRMAESLWMTFNPAGPGRGGWEMDKMGRWVDPSTVVVNGSQTMHAIWSGVRHLQAAVQIESLDAPVVMPGNSLIPTGAFNLGTDGQSHPERGWSFNLFNNAWSTNFPFFTLNAAERFRWRLQLGHIASTSETISVFI